MDLTTFPRPAGDTGVGFHWFPDALHYDKVWLKRFGSELKALGASWLVLPCTLGSPVPDAFLAGLKDRSIEPVLRIATEFVGPVDKNALIELARSYAQSGGHYVYLFDRPNSRTSWLRWDADRLPDRVADFLLPALEALTAIDGIVPLIPPLAAPGDWSDRAFLAELLRSLCRRASTGVLDRVGLALHNYADNKPLTWGAGGRAAWPDTPLFTGSEGAEDHLGFRLFEWYDEIVRETIGRAMPMVACEGGSLLGDAGRAALPRVDSDLHATRNSQIAHLMSSSEVPDHLLNCAFWVFSAEDSQACSAHRWYKPDGSPQRTVTIEAMKAVQTPARRPLTVPSSITVLMPDGRIETMPMQEYLRGVVVSELPYTASMEALKAQAIAARTYAARSVASPRHGKAAVCTEPHCQAWSTRRQPTTDEAVNSTDGAIVEIGGACIGAFYFAHCDGHTRNSEDVWKYALPYCRSVSCSCGNTQLHGHGVGMCQEGAMAMAKQGATAGEILTHYYTGANVHGTSGA
jgi:hypothetical protein